MAALFQVSVTDPEHQKIVDKGGDALKRLCREEAVAFSDWLRENEPNFQDGLADWERHIISVYLDKTSRGVRDGPEEAPTSVIPEEGQDGSP